MKSLPIEKWSHIVVRVSNLENSLKFYKEHLGFEPVGDLDIGGPKLEEILSGHTGTPVRNAKGRLVMGKIGGQLVELIHYEGDCESELCSPGIGAFTLIVSDIDEAHRIALEAGLRPETEPVEIERSRQFFIRDPDGISIELTQPPRE